MQEESDGMLHKVERYTYDLDKRVTVLETQMTTHTSKLEKIDNKLESMFKFLRDHISAEDKERVQLLSKINMVLVTIALGVASFFGKEAFTKLFGG